MVLIYVQSTYALCINVSNLREKIQKLIGCLTRSLAVLGECPYYYVEISYVFTL